MSVTPVSGFPPMGQNVAVSLKWERPHFIEKRTEAQRVRGRTGPGSDFQTLRMSLDAISILLILHWCWVGKGWES